MARIDGKQYCNRCRELRDDVYFGTCLNCDARGRQMKAMRESGLTLAVIGSQFGLCRERVRQVIASWERRQRQLSRLNSL